MADVPKSKDYANLLTDKVLAHFVETLPPDVRKVWRDPAIRGFVQTASFSDLGISVAVPSPGDNWLDADDISEKMRSELQTIYAEWQAESEKRTELQRKLSAVARSVTTRKALVDLLPEFEKYLPADGETSRTVPVVVNVVSEFMQAGWPKGEVSK